jgi:DNA-binding NtrC family response regulator
VTTCNNGVEGFELYHEGADRYDLILADQEMPMLTGDLAVELLEMNPELPTLLSTGFSDTLSADQAKTMGIKTYLPKPFDLQLLRDTISSCLPSNDK